MLRPGVRTAVALAGSCHPGPVAGVTAVAAALGAVAGDGPGRTVVLTVAVLAGQLSIGWVNDLVDADRDRTVGRRDKPLARGDLAARTVVVAIALALLVLVALSFVLGWRAGLLNLATVASGWSYDLGVKATWLSPVPYAFSFGALPAVATLAAPGHPWPAAWVLGAGALLGLAAHVANVLPDLADDRATGVRGLPHRIGARPSVAVTVVLLLGATACVVFGPPGPPSTGRWVGLGLVVAAAAVVLRSLPRPRSRLPFLAIVGAAAVNVVMLLTSGTLH